MFDNKDGTKYAIGHNITLSSSTTTEGRYENPTNSHLNKSAAERMVELLNQIWGPNTHWIIPLNEPIED
jgi:hypothetical protein